MRENATFDNAKQKPTTLTDVDQKISSHQVHVSRVYARSLFRVGHGSHLFDPTQPSS